MTMDFPVAPSVNLNGIKPGSRVNFSLEKGKDGMYQVQSVQPAAAGNDEHAPICASQRPGREPAPLRPGHCRRRRACRPAPSLFAVPSPRASAPLLSGRDFALEIGPVPVNMTGRPRTAIGVNGQVPAPILRWREGDTVTLAVTNRLARAELDPLARHPHALADGWRAGLEFCRHRARRDLHLPLSRPSKRHLLVSLAIRRFRSRAASTARSSSSRSAGYAQPFDRDYVVLLSDWSDESPETIVSNLKFQSDYYNFGQRTVGTFFADTREKGLAATVSDRLEWGKMRMSPTDILDVTGATYTYLVNGKPPAANWTALFRPGERVRLRFINGSSMSIFDVRIPGLKMTVVQADGNDVEPVTVDEFRIGTAETYDVIVQPDADRAFTIFAQAEDRSGFARGTLAPRAGMAGAVPPLDPRPLRSMADMGMGGMDHGCDGTTWVNGHGMDPRPRHGPRACRMPGMDHSSMPGMSRQRHADGPWRHGNGGNAGALKESVEVDNVADDAARPSQRGRQRARRQWPACPAYTDLRATQARRRSAAAFARDHPASHRQHAALHLGVRRQEIFRSRTHPSRARRARALRAHQRQHDGAPDPSARPMERARQRPGRVTGPTSTRSL